MFISKKLSPSKWKQWAVGLAGYTAFSVDQAISGWFWNLINGLPRDYFAKTFDQVNYLDKRIWEGMFRARIEDLKEQLESGTSKKAFQEDLIRLQGLVGKYSLSPVIYEDGLSELENFISNLDNSGNYVKILTEVRNEFREELKAQPLLLKECIKGDANLGRKEIAYYKSLLDDKGNLKSISSKKVLTQSSISDKVVVNRRKDGNSKLRNISKLLLGSPTQAITLFLAAQSAFASAATIQPSNSSELAIGNHTLPFDNKLLSVFGIKDSTVLQRNDASIKNVVSESPTLLSGSNSTLDKIGEDAAISTEGPSYSIFTDAFKDKIEKVKDEINKLIIALTKDNNIQRSKRSVVTHGSATANSASSGVFTSPNSSSNTNSPY